MKKLFLLSFVLILIGGNALGMKDIEISEEKIEGKKCIHACLIEGNYSHTLTIFKDDQECGVTYKPAPKNSFLKSIGVPIYTDKKDMLRAAILKYKEDMSGTSSPVRKRVNKREVELGVEKLYPYGGEARI